MKKLPKIYQAEFNKKINNNKKFCCVEEKTESVEHISAEENIQELINDIFSGIGYSYNIPLTIKTINKSYETCLIAQTKHNVITIENEVIPISEIITIKRKKN